MRLVLERADLLKILGAQLKVVLTDDQVVIRTEGAFEVEINGIPMGQEMLAGDDTPPKRPVRAPPPVDEIRLKLADTVAEDAELAARRADAEASTEPPPGGTDGQEVTEAGGGSPLAIVQRSRQLEAELERNRPARLVRRGGGSSVAPTDMKGEVP
jgi:hypothetical protein